MSKEGFIDIAPHIVDERASVRKALKQLNDLPGERMTLFVVDSEGRVKGSLTDGDIRRGLLRGESLEGPVASVMFRDFRRIGRDDNFYEAVSQFSKAGFNPIPVIGATGEIESLIDVTLIRPVLPVEAVLMAGGRGERLRPLTLETPKPLLKVGGRPIIDYNIEALRNAGVEKIYVTVNYLKEQLINHFRNKGDGTMCVAEPVRMGTFGSLSLIPPPTAPYILVMNSDLLTNINFEDLLNRHLNTGADLTMSVIPYSVSVPFAIVDTEGDRVEALREKPVYNYFANAGVYIMRSELIKMIPADTYLDAPDFIERLIGMGKKVSYYQIEGTWIDIGSPEDYRRADRLMQTH